MELDIIDPEPQAFIGVGFHNRVIFNIVEEDAGFMSTGLSVIQWLKRDRNKFVSTIIESQSYNSIKYIFDDKIEFTEFYSFDNENRESFQDILGLIKKCDSYKHFYIYDVESDTIILKIPELPEIYALDYNNSKDVRKIINSIN